MQNLLPIENVISKNYKRTTGKEAWRENLHYAIFAADKIRSTLGPKGAYKLISYNRGPEQVVKITKDAIAILDELAILYPPAVIVAESAKMQREEAGDGVACFVVFLSALLKKADELLAMKIHPNIITHGYSLATNRALEIMEKQSLPYSDVNQNILDVVDCDRKILSPLLRSMIMDAYNLACADGKFDREFVRFLKKTGGSLMESNLIRGVVIKKEKAHPNMPDCLNHLRVAITSEKPGINRLELKMKGQGPAHLNYMVKDASDLEEYRAAEGKIKLEALDRLFELKANVLLCEQPLDAQLKDKLLAHGVFALERVDRKDMQAVAQATGAKIVGQLKDLSQEDLGEAEELYTGRVELEKTVTIGGCRGATFVLRGSTAQTIDELESAIKNSLTILKLMGRIDRVVPGGGATEVQVAQELEDFAKGFACREQIAIEAFAAGLLDIPRCLAENYGLNSTDVLLELKKNHSEGLWGYGVAEICHEGVCFEPLGVKRSVIRRAHEVATLMLRIDELLISKEIAKFHKK